MHAHVPETELARFAADPDSVSRERRAAIEAAAAECATCRGSIDFFSVIGDDDLSDPATWDAQTEWSSENPMRLYAERIADEDRAADELLQETKLLDSPTKLAWRNLQRDRRFTNGGVVRRLNAYAHSVYQDEPLTALTLADASISIAETLPDEYYPWNAVFELRGAAWKARANALLVSGEFVAAHEALTHADRAYRRLNSPAFGLSAVAITRASVFCEQGRLEEAAASAEAAELGFAHLGQDERRMHAVFARGSIHYEAGNIDRICLPAEAVDARRRVAQHLLECLYC
jgi:hypothetical protein